MKTKIFNLIILDESGSMSFVERQTINGCNETIDTIVNAQKKYKETQEHFVSIYAFQDGGNRDSRYLIKNMKADEVKKISDQDYCPGGCTPLNDAVGATLTDLKRKVEKEDFAIGSVTIITDGEENASVHYTVGQVAMMIAQLKEMGWNFNFIGANIDVKKEAQKLNIDNCLAFTQTEEETEMMFEVEKQARNSYYSRVDSMQRLCQNSEKDYRSMMREASDNYFEQKQTQKTLRMTPEKIKTLKRNEIFVFGSNLQGNHAGGAARAAHQHFGAIMGQGVGLQGQSYAIPTMQGGVDTIRPYVEEFINFAKRHREMKFLVTSIGCGIAGFKAEEIAPLFKGATDIDNIYLPERFWKVLE